MVIGSIDTYIDPDAVVLGDLDYAAFALAEHGPILQAAGRGELVTRTLTIIADLRAGRRGRRAAELGAVLAQLEAITQASLPPPDRPTTTWPPPK
jgi:hypothetical protein